MLFRSYKERESRLLRNVEAWEKSRRILAYARLLKRRVIERDGTLDSESLMGRCLQWIERYADRMDPTRDPTPAEDWAQEL